MMSHPEFPTIDEESLRRAANQAALAIPPAWPLASSVAVNPFLGQSGEGLAEVAARLARVAGVAVTMARDWYQERISSGAISDADLADALIDSPDERRPTSLAALKAMALTPSPTLIALPTIADLAAQASGIDWPALIAERLGSWAAGYFDDGQALWAAPRGTGAYAAWRAVATHDLTPEIAGLHRFATHVSEAPDNTRGAIARAVQRLHLTAGSLETYFHQLLMSLGGWAQYARYLRWRAELGGAWDETITDLLAVRLIWEEALFERYLEQIAGPWTAVLAEHAAPLAPTTNQIVDAILQEASERAVQRSLALLLSAAAPAVSEGRPALQVAFCIDVRSEVFRRALEGVNPGIRTRGFAGFFGLTASHRRFASDVHELRLPVLLNPAVTTCAGGPHDMPADQAMRFKARARRVWGRFKLAAVSSFAFVEATGPVYVGKLLMDSFGLHSAPAPNDPAPRFDPELDIATRVQTAEGILRAMSLTANFARLVLIAGHGANVVNNPHASALHCGACGGYSGEVNARLLASLLNDAAVRAGLETFDIVVPADSLFVGALHDTTTDAVTLYADDHLSPTHDEDLKTAKTWLAAAGQATRSERALRLPRADGERRIARRSRDWAEVRPEWALAGCQAFIAAPRSRTAGRSFVGRAFLHDYEWRQDSEFAVLELIMTAPVVVASWISLQYYGSTVAPDVFGAGNKLLHNVVGGIGVLEGNGGVLRAGLPWQSIHDGERYIHEPMRLSVCIEAPREAMTDILARHESVRALFDHRWLHLFALDEDGLMAWRYAGDLQWTPMSDATTRESQLRLEV